MTDGALFTFGALGWLIVILAVAFRTGAVDRIADWLVGRRPEAPRWPGERGGKGHLRIVGPPSPLPYRSPPCDLEGWDDPKDVA